MRVKIAKTVNGGMDAGESLQADAWDLSKGCKSRGGCKKQFRGSFKPDVLMSCHVGGCLPSHPDILYASLRGRPPGTASLGVK